MLTKTKTNMTKSMTTKSMSKHDDKMMTMMTMRLCWCHEMCRRHGAVSLCERRRWVVTISTAMTWLHSRSDGHEQCHLPFANVTSCSPVSPCTLALTLPG